MIVIVPTEPYWDRILGDQPCEGQAPWVFLHNGEWYSLESCDVDSPGVSQSAVAHRNQGLPLVWEGKLVTASADLLHRLLARQDGQTLQEYAQALEAQGVAARVHNSLGSGSERQMAPTIL